MNYKQYKECSLYQNFVYPRYISELPDFPFKPVYDAELESYINGFIKIDKENELWWQLSTFNFDGVIVPKYTFSESYISNDKTKIEYYVNNLLDDTECFIHRSCGTWIGNTNTDERIKEMTPSDLDGNGTEVTIAYKKIWGFEPDKAESYSDISAGYINGFSKKYYSVFVKEADGIKSYIPTVEGKPLTDTQISDIINHPTNYPDKASGNLFVSD